MDLLGVGRYFLTRCRCWAKFEKNSSYIHSDFQVANPILILLLIPLFDQVIYPALGRFEIVWWFDKRFPTLQASVVSWRPPCRGLWPAASCVACHSSSPECWSWSWGKDIQICLKLIRYEKDSLFFSSSVMDLDNTGVVGYTLYKSFCICCKRSDRAPAGTSS